MQINQQLAIILSANIQIRFHAQQVIFRLLSVNHLALFVQQVASAQLQH